MSKKRVLFVSLTNVKGGMETVMADLALGLDRERFEPLTAFLMEGPLSEDLREKGIPTFVLPPHRARELHKVAGTIRRLARIIREERVDVVHGNGPNLMLYAGYAARLAGRPCVWHVYDPFGVADWHTRIAVNAQRLLRPDWTIFGTPACGDCYRAMYPRLGQQSMVLPGTDPDELMREADPARALPSLGIADDGGPVVSMFARLQAYKGQQDLVAAAAEVVRRHPKAKFLLCGGTMLDIEPDFPARVEAQIADLGLRDNVFLCGYITHQQKKDILAASAVVVHPAWQEPFGISVIEGMAVGKPVVVTNALGPSITVKDGETGFIVPASNKDALGAAIVRLLDDPAEAKRMGENGRRRVKENYTVQATVRQVEQIYETVTARGKVTPPPLPAGAKAN